MNVLCWLFSGFDRHITSEHLLTAVIAALCDAGHAVHVIQKDTGGPLPSLPQSLAGYPVTTQVVPFKAADKGNLVARYLADLKYIQSCKKHIDKDYDAVFIQSTTVGGFAVQAVRSRLKNAIVTFNVQDIFPYNAAFSGKIKRNSLAFKVLAGIQRYGYRQSDHIITISEDMKNTLVEDGTNASKIEVIYNWSYQDGLYDRDKLDFSAVAHMFCKDYFNVVYAGNIGVMQNVDLLIEAAKLMKGEQTVWFHIIGNGVYKDTLEAKAKAYGIKNISFWPMQPPELAPVIYSAADVNVIPLEKEIYKTALPSKTATCLACQKPIIFAIGEESEFGHLAAVKTACPVVDSDNPEELVKAIRGIQEKKIQCVTAEFYLKNSSLSKNSARYAKVITEGDIHQ